MKRRTAAVLLFGAAVALAGCTPGPDVPDGARPAIFDRESTAEDALPAEVTADIQTGSSRYVGKDSAGNAYWVALGQDVGTRCIVFAPERPDGWATACGGGGPTGTAADGTVFEFASSPSTLDPDSAELVGDTLLVQLPG